MKLRVFILALLIGTAAIAADAQKIAATDAVRLVAEGKAVLVDCREPAEWAASGVAAPAVLLPKSDFDGARKQWDEFLEKNRGKQVILYCKSGARSGTIAAELEEKGVKAANLGSLRDWTNAGLPTRKVDA